MKNIFILIFSIFLLGTSASALGRDCYSKVLKGYRFDSTSFQIYSEEVAELFEGQASRASVLAIYLLENELGCEEGELAPLSIGCQTIVPGKPLSKACYAESSRGYFFITVDMLQNVNLVFNRFD